MKMKNLVLVKFVVLIIKMSLFSKYNFTGTERVLSLLHCRSSGGAKQILFTSKDLSPELSELKSNCILYKNTKKGNYGMTISHFFCFSLKYSTEI